MFGRAEKDRVAGVVVTTAYSGGTLRDIERASQEFFVAHAAIVALSSLSAGPADSPPAVSLAPLKLERDRALRAVRRHRACDRSDIQAKMSVFFALEDWFGCEENSVAEFSAEILHEAAPFLAADRSKILSANFIQRSSQPMRLAWFDRLPRFSRFAQSQSPSE